MAKKTDRTFWSRLREALKDAGKPATQDYAASIIRIKQPSVSLWNKPGGYPEVEHVVELAKAANACVEWLYTGREPKRPPPPDSTAQRLWEIWPRIDDVTKGEIVRLAIERADPPDAVGVRDSKRA